MKVLIATGVYPPESGGPATYARLLEQRLPALGLEVSVLPFRTVRHLPKALRHLAYLFACIRRGRGVDLIYALDTVSVGFPAALAAVILRKPFMVRVPGDYAWEQGRQRFGVGEELEQFQQKRYGSRVEALRRVQRFVVARAQKVIVPSNFMKVLVGKWVQKDKIEVIYSSVEEPKVLMPKERPHGFLVVTAARRVPWKGIEGIEKVVAQQLGWKFFLAENLPREEALGWVAAADAFVLNSTYEGLSHALIEAMMLGTPVIATRVGGNPELIRDGVDGLLVEPGNNAELLEALKTIEGDREGARVRALSAKERARMFSIDTTIKKTAHALASV